MHGLYLLYWVQEKHVPAAHVAAALVVGDLALTLFEIPTGWIADRCGHRASLIAGSILQVAGMLLCWLGRGASGVMAACVCVALGDAFRSGANQALLYRSCIVIGRADEFQTIEARSHAVQLVALVLFILVGGAVVHAWGFAAGWSVEVALSAAGLAITCAMIEPPVGTDVVAPDAPAMREPASACARAGLGGLLALILPAAMLGSLASAASFLAQTSESLSPGRATLLVAGITLAEVVGSLVVHYAPRRFNTSRRTRCGRARRRSRVP